MRRRAHHGRTRSGTDASAASDVHTVREARSRSLGLEASCVTSRALRGNELPRSTERWRQGSGDPSRWRGRRLDPTALGRAFRAARGQLSRRGAGSFPDTCRCRARARSRARGAGAQRMSATVAGFARQSEKCAGWLTFREGALVRRAERGRARFPTRIDARARTCVAREAAATGLAPTLVRAATVVEATRELECELACCFGRVRPHREPAHIELGARRPGTHEDRREASDDEQVPRRDADADESCAHRGLECSIERVCASSNLSSTRCDRLLSGMRTGA